MANCNDLSNNHTMNTMLAEEMTRTGIGCDVYSTKKINILVVGRSHAGKTTLIRSLEDPMYASTYTEYARTRNPKNHTMVTRHNQTNMYYQLNMIDTAGLQEVTERKEDQRTDEQLLDLAARCVKQEITTLNVVIFMSEAGKAQTQDVDTFISIMDFLGPKFEDISMMVLSHCEGFKEDRLQLFVNNIRTHPSSAKAFRYCKLGIFFHGAIDFDDMSTLDDDIDFRRRYVRRKMERIAPMRQLLMETFISRAGQEVPVDKIQLLMDQATEKLKADIKAEIAKNPSRCTLM
jgi:small GTP-binding protein